MNLNRISLLLLFVYFNNIGNVYGQPHIIRVPEGICDCPKKIAQVVTYAAREKEISCYIDNVHFAPPNGLRTPNKPKLFGLNWVEETTTTTTLSPRTSAVSPTKSATSARATSSSSSTTYSMTSSNPKPIPADHSEKSVIQPVSTIESYTAHRDDATASSKTATTSLLTNKMRRKKKAPKKRHVKKDVAITSSEALVTSSQTSKQPSELVTRSNRDVMLEPTSSAAFQNSTDEDFTAVFTESGSGEPPGGTLLDLFQTYDFDREKQDKHLVTVQCNDPGSNTPILYGMYLIEVTDINDNFPIFVESSLRSTVSAETNMGDAVLQLRATDADIGENAELRYGWVKGTEQITYKNGTKVHDPHHAVVFPSGFVILVNSLEPDTEFSFAVTVKDRGDHFDGNRATATATVTVFGTDPPTPAPKNDEKSSWVIYVIISICAVILVSIGFAIIYLRRRKRKRLQRPMLVIDDSSVLDNDEDLRRFEDHSVNRDNRNDPSVQPLRRHQDSSDDEMLKDLARSEC